MMNTYRLPSSNSITLYPCSKGTAKLCPSTLHRNLCNKVVTFTAQHMARDANRVVCTIQLPDSQGKSETYISTFLVPTTVAWKGDSVTHYCEGELQDCDTQYGALINKSTQVLIDRNNSAMLCTSHAWKCALRANVLDSAPRCSPSPEKHRALIQPTAVLSSVFGFAGRLFGEPAASSAQPIVSDSKDCLPDSRPPSSPDCGPAFGTLLISGPSGSGITTLAHSIADKYSAATICITTGALYASETRVFSREWAQQQLLAQVMQAVALRRCVLVLDDLHYLVPRRGTSGERDSAGDNGAVGVGASAPAAVHTDAEEGFIEAIVKAVTSLSASVASMRDGCGLSTHNAGGAPLQLLVIGCACDERMVDPRVVDCFQEKVAIPLPTAQERRRIMRTAWAEAVEERAGAETGAAGSMSSVLVYPKETLYAWADALAGVPVVPLYNACKSYVESTIQQMDADTRAASDVYNGTVARKPFGRVAGLQAVKQKLVETVLWPRRHAAIYRSFASTAIYNTSDGAVDKDGEEAAGAMSFAAGILLFGPPGTGKTLLPRVLAEELGCSLVDVRISDVVRGEIGTSERRVVQLFQEAKSSAPCVVFIDEFQALFTAREEGSSGGGDGGTLTAALAGCFDDINTWNKHAGAESLVTVIASTNEPWAIDAAFLRPGRLDMCVFVGPLDAAGRQEFLSHNLALQHPQLLLQDTSMLCQQVAAATEGFTGADLTLLLSRATELSFQRSPALLDPQDPQQPELCWRDFEAALLSTRASTTPGDVEEYLDWQRLYPYL